MDCVKSSSVTVAKMTRKGSTKERKMVRFCGMYTLNHNRNKPHPLLNMELTIKTITRMMTMSHISGHFWIVWAAVVLGAYKKYGCP